MIRYQVKGENLLRHNIEKSRNSCVKKSENLYGEFKFTCRGMPILRSLGYSISRSQHIKKSKNLYREVYMLTSQKNISILVKTTHR